ncbi:hypothetical protein ACEPAF_4246 [Sanghuangporus sanghuang]
MLKHQLLSNPIDADFAAPTALLPSSKNIPVTPLADLRSCVDYLRFLYNPEVRGSKRKKGPTAGSMLSEENPDSDRVRALRADAFERAHAIRWLTSLVARGDDLANATETSSGLRDGGNENAVRERLIEDAASLLAACAGTAGSGRLSRSYVFGPSPCSERATLTLTDAPLENGDYSSVGAQTWGGACVMADMIFESPEQFDLPAARAGGNIDAEHAFRILELGAGTGLVGLAIMKLMELRNIRSDVVLTDFYPSVLANLRSNVAVNFPSSSGDRLRVFVSSLDWSTYASKSSSEREHLGSFNLVVGADIVYESEHAMWIKSCLEKLLRTNAHFHLVIPLRRTHTAESSTVERVFGEGAPDNKFEIIHQERFSCDAHSDGDSRSMDRGDEVEYAYYKVGWKRR